MTRLRKMMLEELQRLNYAETTIRHYIRTVEDFARRFNRPPDRLGPRHIREYQAELFQKRKLSPNSVTRHLAALRFFYIKILKRSWSITETPYPKWVFHLPTILSQEEVTQLIDLHLLPEGFVRIRNFGFLANRKRATALPLCFQLLGATPNAKQEISTASPSDLWTCPKCAGPMMVIEKFTAAEIQLRSPPAPDAVTA